MLLPTKRAKNTSLSLTKDGYSYMLLLCVSVSKFILKCHTLKVQLLQEC